MQLYIRYNEFRYILFRYTKMPDFLDEIKILLRWLYSKLLQKYACERGVAWFENIFY